MSPGSDGDVASEAHGTGHDAARESAVSGRTAMGYLRFAVYSLTGLLGVSLLAIGTVAIIHEIKGTWHWQIHLESMISYMAVLIGGILAVLVPLFVVLIVGRWWLR